MDMPKLHPSINTLSHAPIRALRLQCQACRRTLPRRRSPKEWETSQSSVAERTSMLDDPDQDADLAAIARDELSSETGKLESLARKLDASLTPRHPFADFPCMIEFRQGPGGLEGRYFMDTLFKMYKTPTRLCVRLTCASDSLILTSARATGSSTCSEHGEKDSRSGS
ncbi:hypothetical protein BKA56DRAFT_624837 [Ilyonectria sp. MPI-CAGE-AT-0026]|nr:hypothetical protein BKA56DRAFT_624837 [Ilyonectria sp. MPI-CAGE-AT-0026]